LIEGTDLASKSLEEVIMESSKDSSKMTVFNNAAQVWNHTFYWHCMKPNGGGEPQGNLKKQLEKAFGTYDAFKEQFKQAAVSQFGSGWAWLVFDKGALKITKTGNADLPLVHGQKALLTCDVWEHAYYLDYQNRRPDYVDIFLNHLINWDFVEENLSKAA
jgi:Fe-Mn family superoxide dismutase